MVFTRRSQITVSPILAVEGDYIERVNSYKYLSIWLDERWAFNIHIQNLNCVFSFILRSAFPLVSVQCWIMMKWFICMQTYSY